MEGRKFRLKNREEILAILGPQDGALRDLERRLRVRLYVRHHPETESADLTVTGKPAAADKAVRQLRETLGAFYDDRLRDNTPHGAEAQPMPVDALWRTHYGEIIRPRTENQRKYVEAVMSRDLVFGIGPAGTGKTFMAAACALRALNEGSARRIILTRPIVEAGEKLGYLPGDISDKVHPYLRPLYDAFFVLLGPDRFRALRADEVIETVPLAYMRGRTLENSFIILDEAQNTLPEQMKMFLTRLGQYSRMVVTGDVTQIDIREKDRSGLIMAQKILKKVRGVRFVNFTAKDVSRHPLVKDIISAYDSWEKAGS